MKISPNIALENLVCIKDSLTCGIFYLFIYLIFIDFVESVAT